MESNSAIAIIIFVVASLLVGASLKIILKKSPVPYTVGLFIVGLIFGILDRSNVFGDTSLLHNALNSVGNADPHTLLYIFLPILIFDAAYEMDFHIFKKNLTNAIILAIPGVIVGMLVSAALMMGLSRLFPEYREWTWTVAFMFGALISATDPVAVVSLLKELKTSKRFSTLVDAESLLNDGTGIVLFMMFFNAYTNSVSNSIGGAISRFLVVVAGGILLGAGLAAICLWVIKKLKGEANLQNSIIILCSYLNFLIAESVLHVSGVIALVAFGLAVAYYGKLELNKKINSFVGEFWELAAYIANTLIFLIVGIVIAIRVELSLNNFLMLIIVYIGVNLIRTMIVFGFFPVMKRLGYGLTQREGVILSWGGLRGAVGLTLALMVAGTSAFPEEIGDQILFLTAGIVALTLVVNASSIGWLLKKLGLTYHPLIEKIVDQSVAGKMRAELVKYMDDLKENPRLREADWEQIEAIIPAEYDLSDIEDLDDNQVVCALRTKILEQESDLCWKLYNKGVFSRRVLKNISRVVELQNDSDGTIPLTQQQSLLGEFIKKKEFNRLKFMPVLSKKLNKKLEEKIIHQYEMCRCFIILQQSSLSLIKAIDESSSFPSGEKPNLKVLKDELRANLDAASEMITKIADAHTEIYKKAVTEKAIVMMKTKAQEIENRYKSEAFIRE